MDVWIYGELLAHSGHVHIKLYTVEPPYLDASAIHRLNTAQNFK